MQKNIDKAKKNIEQGRIIKFDCTKRRGFGERVTSYLWFLFLWTCEEKPCVKQTLDEFDVQRNKGRQNDQPRGGGGSGNSNQNIKQTTKDVSSFCNDN